jgi:hypothetical protein
VLDSRTSWLAVARSVVAVLGGAALVSAPAGAQPDLSGVWLPDVADQRRKERSELPPWTAAAKAQIDFLFAAHPGARHDARRRRRQPAAAHLHRRPRAHPEDPDLTIHGHSIGHWDGETLVVDTVGILP